MMAVECILAALVVRFDGALYWHKTRRAKALLKSLLPLRTQPVGT